MPSQWICAGWKSILLHCIGILFKIMNDQPIAPEIDDFSWKLRSKNLPSEMILTPKDGCGSKTSVFRRVTWPNLQNRALSSWSRDHHIAEQNRNPSVYDDPTF